MIHEMHQSAVERRDEAPSVACGSATNAIEATSMEPPLPNEIIRTVLGFAYRGDLEALKRAVEVSRRILLAKGGNYNRTPLMEAAIKGHASVASYLLKQEEIDINLVDGDGRTALWYSCCCGQPEIAYLLLKAGANAVLSSDVGSTPLMVAACNGHADIVEALLKYQHLQQAAAITTTTLPTQHQIALDSVQNAGRSALWGATYYGRSQAVRLLLQGKADWTIQAADGRAPIHVAKERGHVECEQLLQDAERVYLLVKAREIHDVSETISALPCGRTRSSTQQQHYLHAPVFARPRIREAQTGGRPFPVIEPTYTEEDEEEMEEEEEKKEKEKDSSLPDQFQCMEQITDSTTTISTTTAATTATTAAITTLPTIATTTITPPATPTTTTTTITTTTTTRKRKLKLSSPSASSNTTTTEEEEEGRSTTRCYNLRTTRSSSVVGRKRGRAERVDGGRSVKGRGTGRQEVEQQVVEKKEGEGMEKEKEGDGKPPATPTFTATSAKGEGEGSVVVLPELVVPSASIPTIINLQYLSGVIASYCIREMKQDLFTDLVGWMSI